jgi:flagellar basal-body rod protein FlgF
VLKGIAAAASGMLPQLKRQEVISNNLANAATAGYKRDRLFVQELDQAQARTAPNEADWEMPHQIGIRVDFSAGPMERTGNPYDVAIAGDGFFVVESQGAERFTRNGHFEVNPDGVLSTVDGDPVMGEGGEIRLSAGDVAIATDGTVAVDGRTIDKLRIVRFADPNVLVRSGSSLFAIGQTGAAAEDVESPSVRQGFLEQSNVNTIEEMVNMITTFRFYEADQRAVQMQDQVQGRVVNDLGRVPL